MKNFSTQLEEFRQARQISKKDLASAAGLTASYVSQLTLGERSAPSEEVVYALARALDLDEEATTRLFQSAGYSFIAPIKTDTPERQEFPYREDLREAPGAQAFYGRREELITLKQWILDQRCQVALVLGIGGVGKTTLISALTEQIKNQFKYVFWRSLHNAPPLKNILRDCIQFVSNQSLIDLPESIDDQITLLTEYLRNHQCLVILDNAESILQSGQRASQYLEGYEEYGRLIQRIGEVQHQSCLLLTSREKPRDMAYLEGKASPGRTLHLSGVGQMDGREILQDKEIFGSDESWAELIRLYSGNPLALKLVSESIQEVFGGDINSFLKDEEIVFGDINELVDQQFHRLSGLEQDVLSWLAIEREPVPLEGVRENLTHPVAKGIFFEVLASLLRRSMIEKRESVLFTLQPVIMEYVTTELIKRACREFNKEFDVETGGVWMNFALIKAQTKDYVRDSQVRLILTPVAQQLQLFWGRDGIEQKIKGMLSVLRQVHPQPRSYLAGNALNLLIHLQSDLRGLDFSRLMIWQAYLQGAALPEVNFALAHFIASVFTNPFGNILSVVFDSKGDRLVTGTANGEIWLYDTLTRKPLLICKEHSDAVWSVNLNPNGHTLVSSGDDQTIRLWDVKTGACIKTLKDHTNRVRSTIFSPDGSMLASGSDDQTIRLWDANGDNCIKILEGHSGRVWSLAFSPEGDTLASGSTDKTIHLWDICSGKSIQNLQGHNSWVWSVAFSPDGTLLASASEDKTIRLWEVSSGHCLKVLQEHEYGVRSVAFSPDGKMLASASEDKTIRLWEVSSGHCLKVLQEHEYGVRSVAFSPDGKMLASGGDDQTIRLWEISTGHCLSTLQGHTDRVWTVVFNFNGQILASSNEDQAIRLWHVDRQRCFRTLQDSTHGVRSVAFNPDSSLLVSGGEDQTVRLWDINSGRCLRTLRGHTKWIRTVVFSPDGSQIASGGEDSTIRLWRTNDGQALRTFYGHSSWVRTIDFSPNGLLLATSSDDQTVRLWELATGNCFILNGHEGRVRTAVFNSDGSVIASGSEDRTIRLWDVNRRQTINILHGHASWVLSVAFSLDGELLASSGDDLVILIWNSKTGQCLRKLQGHTKRIRWITFAPHGNVLASCSDDGTIRLWNVQEGECIGKLVSEKPYQNMNISGAKGLTSAQEDMLMRLGAVEGDRA